MNFSKNRQSLNGIYKRLSDGIHQLSHEVKALKTAPNNKYGIVSFHQMSEVAEKTTEFLSLLIVAIDEIDDKITKQDKQMQEIRNAAEMLGYTFPEKPKLFSWNEKPDGRPTAKAKGD